jgi:hypothetical protein
MFSNLSAHLTMKILGLGFELPEARRLADLLVIEIVVLFTLMGYRISRPGFTCTQNKHPESRFVIIGYPDAGERSLGCGIFAAPAACIAGAPATFLHRRN